MDWVVAHNLAMRLSAPPMQYFSGLNIAWVEMAYYARCVNLHPLGWAPRIQSCDKAGSITMQKCQH